MAANADIEGGDAARSGQASAIVRFNVGGAIFCTSASTLLWPGEGTFFAGLLQGDLPSTRDDTGAFFIDRDPLCFGVVLNFLRSHHVYPAGYAETHWFYCVAMAVFANPFMSQLLICCCFAVVVVVFVVVVVVVVVATAAVAVAVAVVVSVAAAAAAAAVAVNGDGSGGGDGGSRECGYVFGG